MRLVAALEHVGHLAARAAEHLDGLARVLARHVHCGLLNGLELAPLLVGLDEHARTAHLELEALAAHRLHQHRQVQHAASGHLDARLVLQFLDAHGYVAFLLAHEAFFELTRTDDLALAAHKRARGRLEHDGHRGLLHLDGVEAHRVLAARHHVADVGVLHAHHGHDVARVNLLLLLFAQRLERERLLDVRVVARAVVFDDEHRLAFVDGAAEQPTHADAPHEARMVHRADLQRHRAGRFAVGRGNLFEDGVEQGQHVHVVVRRIEARVAVHGARVDDGEVQLLVGSFQLHHEVEHLVHHLFGARAGTVDLVHHHHDAQPQLKRVLEHEARLRHGALERIDDEQRAVGHVQHALHLAAEIRVPRRVDDVDLHAVVGDGDVLRQDGDAALALLVV